MGTSLGQLRDTLTDTARATADSPAARADAGTALGHLGRALTLLRRDGVSPAAGDQREQQVAELAAACTEVGIRAPATESTLSRLAAAAADTVGVLREEFTVGSRWAAAAALTDTVASLTEVIARGLTAGPAADWLDAVERQVILIEQTATLHPPTRNDAVLLDRPLPGRSLTASADPAAVVPEAVAVLVQATARPTEPPSIAEVHAYTIAAESLSFAAGNLRPARPAGQVAGPTAPGEAAAGQAAADAWRAVRAALRPFDDGSRRPHRDAPPAVATAGRLHAELRRAGPDPTSWSPPLSAAIAAAAQHLPNLAAQLDRTVRSWAKAGALLAYACDLPGREDRVTEHLRGHRSGGLIRADAVDLRTVSDALDNARLLSAAVATAAADPGVRMAADFPRRAWAAHQSLLAQPQASARLTAATQQANRHLQAARGRPPGPRRAR